MAPTTAQSHPTIPDFGGALESCTLKSYDGRRFILVSKLKKWLNSPLQDSTATHIQILLRSAYEKQFAPVTTNDICSDFLLVFSILLEIGQGHLIEAFLNHSLNDHKLPFNITSLKQTLEAERAQNGDTAIKREVLEAFDGVQWKYCAPSFQLEAKQVHPPQCILPICRRKTINEKGGTAHLWEIEVPEEFVGKSLREKVENSGYEGESGKCYRFALKSFHDTSKNLFLNEKKAFDGLRDQKGMVKRLGSFACFDTGDTSRDTTAHSKSQKTMTHNILFEYGEMDLDEYFVQNHPPFLYSEMLTFWETLFEVVGPVEAIHELKTKDGGPRFQGWHADIKPDNILLVNGEFKLSDPGFAKFIIRKTEDPREKVSGGTWTYGAPERCQRSRDAVTQKIDTWSLGCVFSIAAAWVVGSLSAVRDFSRVRKKAIESIKSSSDVLSGFASADCFHDGNDVLGDVKEWHTILRRSARREDLITCQVLDLVDKHLLRPDHDRMSAMELRRSLKEIMIHAKSQTTDTISPNIMKALQEINEEASPIWQNSSAWQQLKYLDQAEDRKARKSIVMGFPLKRTAQRSEYLKSALSDEYRQFESIRKSNPSPVYPDIKTAKSRTPTSTDMGYSAASQNPNTTQIMHRASGSVHSVALSVATNPTFQRQGSVNRPHKPQDVFQAHKNIETGKPWKKWRREDEILEKYIVYRDIVFLLDNAGTMESCWAQADFLLETLVRKIGKLDKDGMDLYFTLGGAQLERTTDYKKFKKKMESEAPQQGPGFHTDMESAIGKVLSKALKTMKSTKKDLTLLIFTDGLWQGTENKEAINDIIVSAVKDAEKINGPYRKRTLTFQFVRFGQDEEALERLQYLDDVLAFDKQIPDVVDTEHAHGDVYKMVLGSFIEEYDLSEDPLASPPAIAPSRIISEPSGHPNLLSTYASASHRPR